MSSTPVQPMNIFKIFFNALIIYAKKFLPFSRVMLFPVFGQVLGIALILGPVYFYRQNYLITLPVEELRENLLFLLLGLILMVIPGFAIFLKAFWDYMVAMVSLNTMARDVIKKSSFENFKKHNGAVKLKTKNYLALLFILMGIWLVILAFPIAVLFLSLFAASKTLALALFGISALACILLLAIISVYFCLSFQVFAFEKLSPVKVIQKSFNMIEKNFWRTVVLGLILFIATGAIIPGLVQEAVKNSPVMSYLVIPFESYLEILLDNPILMEFMTKKNLTIPYVATEAAIISVGMIVTAFILPMGSTCFTLLYFDVKARK